MSKQIVKVFSLVFFSILIVFSVSFAKSFQVSERSDMPENGITPSLQAGKVTSTESVTTIEIASGVTSKVFWGKGAMVSIITMLPNSEIPKETLTSERLMDHDAGECRATRRWQDGQNAVHASCPHVLLFNWLSWKPRLPIP